MDRLEQLEKKIGDLEQEVQQLRQEVHTLSSQVVQNHPVEKLLWQHGFPVISHGDHSQLLFSSNILPAGLAAFYDLMRRYSFRLFARDLIQIPEGSDLRPLTRYCSPKTVRYYLKVLGELGIALYTGASYRLLKKVPSFGPTLEWFVSEIFRREFLSPALFNVRLQNTRFGGDYDVVSLIAGFLVYVEVKSSPPRGVEHPAVDAFLGRILDLEPHIAVLLVDTELRMRDKLVPLLAESLTKENRSGPDWAIARLSGEIFHIRHSVYLANSRKGIYSNLRACFRDFLLWNRKGAVR